MIYHKYSWLLSAVIKIPYGSLSLHICRFQQLPHASHSEQSEYLPLSSARSVHPFPEAVLLRPPGQFLCPQYQRPVPAVSFPALHGLLLQSVLSHLSVPHGFLRKSVLLFRKSCKYISSFYFHHLWIRLFDSCADFYFDCFCSIRSDKQTVRLSYITHDCLVKRISRNLDR